MLGQTKSESSNEGLVKCLAPQALVHELLKREEKQEENQLLSYSFEFFPPHTEEAEEHLMVKLPKFAKQNPAFVNFTWGSGRTSRSDKAAGGETPRWCSFVAHELGLTANMHLTCTNMDDGMVKEALDWCKANDIRNILALRGDPPLGEEWKASSSGENGFTCALDLVLYIRQHYGDYFSVAVAGYPEGHPDAAAAAAKEDGNGGRSPLSPEDVRVRELVYLKKKQDAGANFIITQLFYDNNHFKRFVTSCRHMGITIPILPGILPMVTYGGSQRMIQLCKTDVPTTIQDKTEEYKDDPEKFKAYGIELCTAMCRDLREFGVRHFHFYTLNQEVASFAVLRGLGVEIQET